MGNKASETITENLFRSLYGVKTFIEKVQYQPNIVLLQKRNFYARLPRFFCEKTDYAIIVEAKTTNHFDTVNASWHILFS